MLVPWENAVKPPYLYVDQNWSQANKPLSYVGFFIFLFFVQSQTTMYTREKEWKTVAHLFSSISSRSGTGWTPPIALKVIVIKWWAIYLKQNFRFGPAGSTENFGNLVKYPTFEVFFFHFFMSKRNRKLAHRVTYIIGLC